MPVNFRTLSRTGFIGEYMSLHAEDQTALAYDYFGALWCLSSVLHRNLVVARPNAPVHLNMYCMFIAESGITRKSTAVSHARNLVEQAFDCIELHKRPMFVEGRTSSTKLEVDLAHHTHDTGEGHVIIPISELVTLLGRGTSAGMAGLLTDLYDCPASRHSPGTVAHGGVHLRNVYPTFLAASTPIWLLRSVTPEVMEGGFTSRCLLVRTEEPKHSRTWVEDSAEVARSSGRCVDQLRHVLRTARTIESIKLNDNARDAFIEWGKTRTLPRDPYGSSFASREDAHILRIAGLLSISDDRWRIHHQDITTAIALVSFSRTCGNELFGARERVSPALRGIERAQSLLAEAGLDGLTQSQLTTKLRRFFTGGEVQTLLAIMHELNMVQRFDLSVGQGRPRTIWRATVSLTRPSAIGTVWNRMEPS